MSEVTGTLSVSINVECPKCEKYLDLFDPKDVGKYMNEDNQIYYVVANFYTNEKDADKPNIDITCKHCEHAFVMHKMEY